jgi:hypothetical protein
MGSYCGLLYKIVVSIGNAKITSSWNMILQRTLLLPSYWVFEKII